MNFRRAPGFLRAPTFPKRPGLAGESGAASLAGRAGDSASSGKGVPFVSGDSGRPIVFLQHRLVSVSSSGALCCLSQAAPILMDETWESRKGQVFLHQGEQETSDFIWKNGS